MSGQINSSMSQSLSADQSDEDDDLSSVKIKSKKMSRQMISNENLDQDDGLKEEENELAPSLIQDELLDDLSVVSENESKSSVSKKDDQKDSKKEESKKPSQKKESDEKEQTKKESKEKQKEKEKEVESDEMRGKREQAEKEKKIESEKLAAEEKVRKDEAQKAEQAKAARVQLAKTYERNGHGLVVLIKLQNIDGSWTLNDNLKAFIDSNTDMGKAFKKIIDDAKSDDTLQTLAATVIARSILRLVFKESDDQWNMLDGKANRWCKIKTKDDSVKKFYEAALQLAGVVIWTIRPRD